MLSYKNLYRLCYCLVGLIVVATFFVSCNSLQAAPPQAPSPLELRVAELEREVAELKAVLRGKATTAPAAATVPQAQLFRVYPSEPNSFFPQEGYGQPVFQSFGGEGGNCAGGNCGAPQSFGRQGFFRRR